MRKIENLVFIELAISPAQVVKILITLSVYGTFGLQFSVCLDIAYRMLQLWTTWHSRMAGYCLRSLLVAVTVLLGIALPKTPPFIGLLGALCFSVLGILAPVWHNVVNCFYRRTTFSIASLQVCIETVIYWDDGFGKYHWRAIKNILIGIFGMVAVIFGSMYAVDEIVKLYN
jgi:solute carrier family 36 (proton-coupled amino acid transporter)